MLRLGLWHRAIQAVENWGSGVPCEQRAVDQLGSACQRVCTNFIAVVSDGAEYPGREKEHVLEAAGNSPEAARKNHVTSDAISPDGCKRVNAIGGSNRSARKQRRIWCRPRRAEETSIQQPHSRTSCGRSQRHHDCGVAKTRSGDGSRTDPEELRVRRASAVTGSMPAAGRRCRSRRATASQLPHAVCST